MDYTDGGSRGGGSCCQNKKNGKKTSTIISSNDKSNARGSFGNKESFPDFSSLNNDFEELEDFESAKDEEEASWNLTPDDSFTMLNREYESMNRDYLEDEDDEEEDFLDQYLLSMSPIIDNKTKARGEKGKKGTPWRTVPRRPNDVSVKCSDSTEEIIGSPSEVALRLNDAIQNYLPRHKIKIQKEVSEEAAVAMGEEFEEEPDDESIENFCLEEEPPRIPKPRGCPGTYDRLQKKNVPCADALTLREIALGRRIKRPTASLPTEDQYEMVQPTGPMARSYGIGEKDNCCCAKKKKRDERRHSPPPPKSCCTKQPRNNKNVSFSF